MDKNNNTLSEVRKTAAQRMQDAENKQRAKSDASNKRTPSSIPVSDKKMKTEGATGAKPGWMLRQDPVLGSRVKAAQAKQKEFKKLVGTKVPVKPTPTQGVEEEASPMIKPPSNRFDNKKEAFTHAKTHGGKVFRSTYIDPNTGNKNITFVVKKEQNVAEAKDSREYDYEGEMAKGQLRTIIANAQRAHDMLKDDTNMAEWVQSKITLASDYISTVADYIQSELKEGKMSGLDIDMQTMKDKDFETHYGKPKREYKPKLKGNQGRLDKNNSGHLDKEVKSMVEVHIASPLSAANANAEYKRQPSNTLKVDVKHLGGVSNHKAIKQHLISKGITAGIGSSDNYNTVHLSNISHSHGEIEKKLGIKEEVKKGLYYYVNRRKKLGISRDKDHPKAPEPQDWKDAAKTAKLNKESKSFLDIRKELDERNLTPVEKIAREELSKMKYKKVRGAPTE